MDDTSTGTSAESSQDRQESEWAERLETELEIQDEDSQPNYLAIVLSGISGAVYAFVLWLALQAHERKAARQMYGQSEREYLSKRTVITGLAGGASMLGLLHIYASNPDSAWWIMGGSIGCVVGLVVLRWLWEG